MRAAWRTSAKSGTMEGPAKLSPRKTAEATNSAGIAMNRSTFRKVSEERSATALRAVDRLEHSMKSRRSAEQLPGGTTTLMTEHGCRMRPEWPSSTTSLLVGIWREELGTRTESLEYLRLRTVGGDPPSVEWPHLGHVPANARGKSSETYSECDRQAAGINGEEDQRGDHRRHRRIGGRRDSDFL